MRDTEFEVPKMDCPSEERLIRMALQPEAGVRGLAFDLERRRVVVRHEGDSAPILGRLEPLGLGAKVVRSAKAIDPAPASPHAAIASEDAPGEARVLRQLLAINAVMFAAEVAVGVVAQSTGLLADSVDMFADAAVYGLALYGVGRAVDRQRRVARASGVLQLILALGVLIEVGRRAFVGSEPFGPLMMGVSAVALVANVTCMALLSRHRTGGVHMKASWIFSTNDVIANLGVIAAGALVAFTGSPVPDLVIGTVIGLVVLGGALRILRMSRATGASAA
ncbi:MAG: cation transporter [Deltaproteobacteria bacterium]|nr:cation transporter [Deltaproteobacteria bacterium]